MCTAVCYASDQFYLGRTLDFDFSYTEEITVTPRRFPFRFLYANPLLDHLAILGVAHVENGYPLYYDAVNEAGLCMAALRFSDYATYHTPSPKKVNLAQFELIPWLLGQCQTVREAKEKLQRLRITADAFSANLPPSPLHWLIADRSGAITVEATQNGITVYDNPIGVLTNSPPFPMQRVYLNHFMHLSPYPPKPRFAADLDFQTYSRGMGAIGLPGDLSSSSRFVRAAFMLHNAQKGKTETENVSQCFHILDTVKQIKGCCLLENDKTEYTIYSVCCNADRGIYYAKTYDSVGLCAVDMHLENLDSHETISYPMQSNTMVLLQNRKADSM